jgi:hypothetical protein
MDEKLNNILNNFHYFSAALISYDIEDVSNIISAYVSV